MTSEKNANAFPFMASLREKSLPAHQGLEKTIALRSQIATVDGYLNLLTSFYGLYGPLEGVLKGFTDLEKIIPSLDKRWKTPALKTDLEKLGRETSAISFARASDLPDIADGGMALGCLYVLEGSTLGGQIISAMLARSLGISPQNGGAFFHGYGAETTAMWAAFKEALEKAAENPSKAERITRGAADMFLKMNSWMSKQRRGNDHDLV